MRPFGIDFLFGCVACIIWAGVGGSASAGDTETVLHEFTYATGKNPLGGPSLDPSTGALYGVASRGGSGNGVIYQMLPPTVSNPSWTYSVIYEFPSPSQNYSGVFLVNGIGYFASISGGSGCGSGGCGAVYSLTPPKSGNGDWTPTLLYQFTGGSDGTEPEGLSIDSNGVLYGATRAGGIGCPSSGPGCGLVYKLTPPQTAGQPWGYSVLYRFPGGKAGELPDGVYFDNQGNLYGSAWNGDVSPLKSLIFKLTPPTGAGEWTETVLYRYYPGSTNCGAGLTVGAAGVVYGVVGGTCNYAIQLTPSASNPNDLVKNVLHAFGAAATLMSVQMGSGGDYYGVTRQADTVFRLQPRPGVPGKWNLKVLSNFANGGAYANGGLVLGSAGVIYGATQSGGHNNGGVIFSLKP